MDSDSWTGRFSNVSRRYQSALQSRSDLYLGFEEIDAEDDHKTEYPCPFCMEDFDIIGLCFHIDDEHPAEARNGYLQVCPVCGDRVGMDMVGHIAMHHAQFFKRRFPKGAILSSLRKELRDGSLQALLGGSSNTFSSSNAAPDPLLSSFIYNLPLGDEPTSAKPDSSTESSSVGKGSDEQVLERTTPPPLPLSDKDHEEKASRCDFVQGLLLSTMFDDIL